MLFFNAEKYFAGKTISTVILLRMMVQVVKLFSSLTFDHDHVNVNSADGRLRQTLSFL